MDLWLAFTSLEEMQKAHDYPIKGVLTNPTLVSLPKRHWKEIIGKMNALGNLPLGLQVVSTEENEMIGEVKTYHEIVNRKELIIKLPFCLNSLRILPFINQLGHAVNMAAICTYSQAVVALEADIQYLSIYVGRVNDGGGDGIELVSLVKKYALGCRKATVVQAASIRTVEQFEEVAKAGADAAVIPFTILEKAMKSEMTDESIRKFADDWATIQ
jgi:TalC/MipB family fructose-6-phosphate aldolase